MTTAALGPAFDVAEIPFSRFGSRFGLSPAPGRGRRAAELHLVSRRNGARPVLRLAPAGAHREPQTAEVRAHPALLSWTGPGGRIDVVYETPDTLRLRGRGIGLDVCAVPGGPSAFTGSGLYRDPVDGAYVFADCETGRHYRVTMISGRAPVRGDQALGAPAALVRLGRDRHAPWEAVIEEYEGARPIYCPPGTFEQAVERAGEQFAQFVETVAPWRSDGTPAAELAAYVLWSATARPAGFPRRPADSGSGHRTEETWSWDHCLNALALADTMPALAWDLLLLPFGRPGPVAPPPGPAARSGVPGEYAARPPVHGWALSQFRARNPEPPGRDELFEGYWRLQEWTGYWLTRRTRGSTPPHNYHGGDDSWDDAAVFDPKQVLESTGLTAFLILQMRELATLATLLTLPKLSAHWLEQADDLLRALVHALRAGDRFAARAEATGRMRTGGSLLDAVPIVLGELLPPEIHEALARRVAEHLAEYEPADGTPASPHFAADGNQHGPAWTPSTVVPIERGLRETGHTALADELSACFRHLCETGGFAEASDAAAGAARRDRAYSWTAGSYLLLARAAELRSR